ncbi:MAG: pyridoxal 5'-phosphate synthase glutaminase subunit PdxT [Anaerolineales bacterium]
MKIGVLALQGDFAEHIVMLRRIGVETVEVRLPEQLEEIDGLIIPGGESTTIGNLATQYKIMAPIKRFGKRHAIWGTCAGAILLASEVQRKQPLLKLMDISIERNAFGRQVDSFESDIYVPALESPQEPFPAVFIRAPIIKQTGKAVEVLARLPADNGSPEIIVAAQQDRLLATSFHPELTHDDRFHRYFLNLVEG